MSSTWRWDSRPHRRRRPRSRPRRRHWRSAASPIPRCSAFRRCARALRGTTRKPTGVDLDPRRIAVTTGSSAGFILAFLALFDPGDRVAVALPGYPPYRNILSALGCEPVMIETTQDDALDDHARDAARRTPQEAAARRADREPGQSDRHHDDGIRPAASCARPRRARASASSPTRSITASTTRSRPRPRRGSRPMR